MLNIVIFISTYLPRQSEGFLKFINYCFFRPINTGICEAALAKVTDLQCFIPSTESHKHMQTLLHFGRKHESQLRPESSMHSCSMGLTLEISREGKRWHKSATIVLMYLIASQSFTTCNDLASLSKSRQPDAKR